MTRPHPLTAMTERQWVLAWEAQQEVLDGLRDGRGSWLPNVVEPRQWGALRWTSGRPTHAAGTGQAVAASFAVLRPDATDRRVRSSVVDALTDPPPVTRIAGIGIGEQRLRDGTLGAVALAVVAAAAAALAGAGWLAVLAAAVLGAGAGGVAGGALADYKVAKSRAKILSDSQQVRVVTGRFAPPAWTRLVRAATLVEQLSGGDTDPRADIQAREAVQAALWEAAGLLLGSSDHTGVEVLAVGMERLAHARRR